MAKKSDSGLRENNESGRPYNSTEILEFLKEFGIRTDRRYSNAELLRRIRDNDFDGLSNVTDVLRERIKAWVKENWDTVKYYVDCPLLADRENGCYSCSDGLASACYAINKDKIEGEQEHEDEPI